MPSPKIRLKIDTIITGNLVYILILSVYSLLMRFVLSREAVGYASFALLFVFLGFQILVIAAYLSGQNSISARVREEHKTDAFRILTYLRRFILLFGAFLSFLMFLFRERISLLYHGTRSYYMIYFVLAFVLLSYAVIGSFTAYFSGVGMKKALHIMLLTLCLLTIILIPVCSKTLEGYGEKVALLLNKGEAKALLSACGILLGIGISAILTGIVLMVLYFMFFRAVRENMLEGAGLIFEEKKRKAEILRHTIRGYAPSVLLFLIPCLLPLADVFFCGISKEERYSAILFSGMYGVVYTTVLFFIFVLLILMSGLLHSLLQDERKGGFVMKEGKTRILFRLSSYYAVPLAFFLFATGSVFTQRDDLLTSMLHIGSMNVLIVGELILFVIVLLKKDKTFSLITTEGIALLAHFVFLFLISRGNMHGGRVLALSITVFYLIWSIALWIAERRTFSVLRKEMYRFMLCILSGAIAALPVYFLSMALVRALGASITIALMIILYFTLYFLFTIFIGAADLKNLHRVPLGGMVLDLMEMIYYHVGYHEEDE